jgi:hypothetical protein
MQTFLPYKNFKKSAKSLDRQRLGKQRIECKQIYGALIFGGSWKNHPAVKMWRGYERSLLKYSIEICNEWISRGYKDSQKQLFVEWLNNQTGTDRKPPWLTDEFCRSHQSNLNRKSDYYKFDVPKNLEYLWPK